ncbi:MAG: 16S rRNA (cytidine(1402)-2'-O)-methyltransferase [Anaerolineaceae bacterium]|nr:16S rRNA (cytidine(1402)-2'-O)-methyltransferase [Anaerolineaceae bacterium]
MTTKKGHLYIVATPIGNPRDITLRALDVLQEVDAVICEEQRVGTTLLKKLGLPNKEIILLNEHNEAEQTPAIGMRLLQEQSLALISDCGTPVFADPGATLINYLVEQEIPVVPVPGPSSLMAALSVLNLKLDRFIYAGFLPRDREERRKAIKHLRHLRIPIIIMDAPYRLGPVLEDVEATLGGGAPVTLAFDLTLPGEAILRGQVGNVRKRVNQRKGEFVLIVH